MLDKRKDNELYLKFSLKALESTMILSEKYYVSQIPGGKIYNQCVNVVWHQGLKHSFFLSRKSSRGSMSEWQLEDQGDRCPAVLLLLLFLACVFFSFSYFILF